MSSGRVLNGASGQFSGQRPFSSELWCLNLWRLATVLLYCSLQAHALESNSVERLQERLLNHISQPRFASAAWGAKVISLDSGQVLFEHNAGKLLKPASNAKLYTAALALDRLSPDYRIETSLHAASQPDKAGALRGDLIVFGRGDPGFAERFRGGNYSAILRPIVDAVIGAGVKQIKGDLVGDESFFRGAPFGSQWTWDDLQHYYGAESSALTVQDNVVDLILQPGVRVGSPCKILTQPSTTFLSFSNRTVTMESGTRSRISLYRPVGENIVHVSGWIPLGGSNVVESISVHRPALWFVNLLRDELVKRGVTVSGKARAVDWLDRQVQPFPRSWIELARVQSPPLLEIAKRMMKPSQNLYAHLLLLQVGALSTNAASATEWTEDTGLIELRRFLDFAGIPRKQVLLEEGSGLSRGALVTPNATIGLLQFMHRHRWAKEFVETLPVAGVDGTLRNRMKGTPAAGNVRAKTGTLRYVNTLSGYMTNRSGENLAFSFMLNNFTEETGRAAIDAMVVMLAEAE